MTLYAATWTGDAAERVLSDPKVIGVLWTGLTRFMRFKRWCSRLWRRLWH